MAYAFPVAFLALWLAGAPLATALLVRRSQPSSATGTLNALDLNGDGVVVVAEAEQFATSQGLSAAEAAEEFKGLDLNGDGHLDTNEVAANLNEQHVAPAPEAVSQAKAPTAKVEQPAAASAAEPRAALPAAASASASETAESVQLRSAAQQVKIRASRIVAQELAKLIENATAAYETDSQQADAYEKQSKVFRAEAVELAQAARAQVEEAAALAAEPMVQSATESLRNSEQEASQAESEAERLRGEAAVYLQKALEAKAGVQQVMLRETSAQQGH